MGTSTEELSNDIARTRADLEQDLDALQDKVSPSAIMERRKTAVRGRLSSAKDRVMGTGQSVVGRVRTPPTASAARPRTPAVPGGPGRGKSPRRRPGGLRCGSRHRRPDARHQGGGPGRPELKDVAQEHGQPVMDQAKSAAQEVGEQLKDKATQAADEVKSSAQESAERVKDEAPTGSSSEQRLVEQRQLHGVAADDVAPRPVERPATRRGRSPSGPPASSGGARPIFHPFGSRFAAVPARRTAVIGYRSGRGGDTGARQPARARVAAEPAHLHRGVEPLPDPRTVRGRPGGAHLLRSPRAAPAGSSRVGVRRPGFGPRLPGGHASRCRRTRAVTRHEPTWPPPRTCGWRSITPT